MKTDEQLEQLLRATFAARSGTVTGGPAWTGDSATEPDADASGEILDLTARRPRYRFAPLAAAAVVALAVVGLVVGIRAATERPTRPAAPDTSAPDSAVPTSASPSSSPPTSPGPSASSSSPTLPPPIRTSGSSSTLRWRMAVDTPAGYRVMDRSVSPTSAGVALWMTDDPDAHGCCGGLPRDVWVLVYQRGFYDPSVARMGTPVTVDGHPGFLANLPPERFGVGNISNDPLPGLAWEYAPDAWATVVATTPATQAEDQLLVVARSVKTRQKIAMRVPMQLSYVPPGLDHVAASEDVRQAYGLSIDLSSSSGPLPRRTLHIQVWRQKLTLFDTDHAKRIIVDGRTAYVSGGRAMVWIGQRTIDIELGYPAAAAQMSRILAGLRWAPDATHEAHWFDATTLLP